MLGSPIEHSKSPALHAAAYRVLGLDWQYDRERVEADGLGDYLHTRGPDWRGLSLTMPLKEAVFPFLARIDPLASAAEAVNTVLVRDDGLHGWNTDVGGIVRAVEERAMAVGNEAVLFGTGATARSVILALHSLGCSRLTVSGRNPSKVADTVAFAESTGFDARPAQGALALTRWPDEASLAVSALPGGVPVELPPVHRGLGLFDVAYSGGSLAQKWQRERPEAPVVEGIDMLVHQALLQVRVFLNGSPEQPVPDEAMVLRAMDAAVGRS